MEALIYAIVTVIFLILLITGKIKHFTHMLQLNSYYNDRFFSYLLNNKNSILNVRMIIPFASLLMYFVNKNIYVTILLYVMLFLLIDIYGKKEKVKKPLVITKRVKRLFATQIILISAILYSGYFVGIYAVIILFALEVLSPFIVILSNVINSPIEKMINKSYYNKAKTKLESMKDLIIIGVTGSFGKTSVKHFVYSLLSAKYNVLMTPGSYNTTMGVVRTINEQLSPMHQVFVVEMGAKNIGDIKEICDLVNPKFAVISAIGEQHLETFKSIANIIKTKFELADAVGDGIKFLNFDNEYIKNHDTKDPIVKYGTNADCDFYAKDIKTTQYGSEFTVVKDGACYNFKTKLLGRHNVVNLTGAIAVANTLGISMSDIAIEMRKINSVKHRLEIIQRGNVTIIDDAYNSNPSGAKFALEVLRDFDGYRILITPGLVELGDKQYEMNYELGAMAPKCADYIIFVGEKQAPPLKEGAMSAGCEEERIYVAKNINDAFNKMYSINEENKVVLLENDLPDNYL